MNAVLLIPNKDTKTTTNCGTQTPFVDFKILFFEQLQIYSELLSDFEKLQ